MYICSRELIAESQYVVVEIVDDYNFEADV